MAEPAHVLGSGLSELTGTTLRQLTGLDDSTLDAVVGRVVGRAGPWDRLWQEDANHGAARRAR
ncbi:hypothetical protein GCM10010149_83100 [Nonomuraea roseoviolacea subsp. roseoviolacea]|uniref:FXSXX-COOH protein n=1 Tax=Nonomuraea roseoviolacea subsp. carminata TaxID=160689 RepID=A0ABT1JWN0_9ACTN|nr:hypothetical protein [Nonomuraea roseoviolacea]MCP2345199.1 hypothetical protein [Nonomuraea roseoviolacea subsp. carminata]